MPELGYSRAVRSDHNISTELMDRRNLISPKYHSPQLVAVE